MSLYDLNAVRQGNAVGYQTCPKCGGQGFVARPPWVAGDVYRWCDNGSGNYSCPVCHGAKLIATVSTPRASEWRPAVEA